VREPDHSGDEQHVTHGHKATYAVVVIGAVAACSALPYGISCVRHTVLAQLENAAIIGVFIAYYCLVADALLWPLAVLELWNPTGTCGRVLNLGIGAYLTALVAFFLWGVAHSPVW
jgi:hypothetical protein